MSHLDKGDRKINHQRLSPLVHKKETKPEKEMKEVCILDELLEIS